MASAITARKELQRAAVIFRQLDLIAPGTRSITIRPLTVNNRRKTWVVMDDALGLPVVADFDAHRAALGLLRRMIPGADWTRPQKYNSLTGELLPAGPAADSINADEVTR
ncbi:hypothetical protein E4K10_18035 [Streptomyces sp. T1317-0309]|nr:hypothetical protein E4K10_18035 [Streptomyces sp. T1317-0309]